MMQDRPETIVSWRIKVQRRLYLEAYRGDAGNLRVLVCNANFLDQIRREVSSTIISASEIAEASRWVTRQIGLEHADLLEGLVAVDARRSRRRHFAIADMTYTSRRDVSQSRMRVDLGDAIENLENKDVALHAAESPTI